MPAAEGEPPAGEGERPAAEGELPVVEGELPVAEGELPAVEMPAAAVGEDRPAAALDDESSSSSECGEQDRLADILPSLMTLVTRQTDMLAELQEARWEDNRNWAAAVGQLADILRCQMGTSGASTPRPMPPTPGPSGTETPRPVARRSRCMRCEPCLAGLPAGARRLPCSTWTLPARARDDKGRWLPEQSDAKPTPQGHEEHGPGQPSHDHAHHVVSAEELHSPVPLAVRAGGEVMEQLPALHVLEKARPVKGCFNQHATRRGAAIRLL